MRTTGRKFVHLGLAIVMAASFALALGVLFAPEGQAISPADWCIQNGGVYENVQGTKSCTYTEVPGNNQGGVTKEDTVDVQGNINSSHDPSYQDCVANNGGDHCKK